MDTNCRVARSELISIASHELRTPLAVLLAYATLLEENAPAAMHEHLGQVVDSAMRLKSIIDEMISLQRIDTGEAQVSLTNVGIASAVKEVLEDLGPLAERKEQAIKMNLPKDSVSVRADEQMLNLILSKLLSNAIKFTSEKGSISVSAKCRGETVVITLTDTGVGIPEEELERIFQRFYQVEDSLRREHGGLGLGLSIARDMAELMDGRIWAESQVGQGSTFYLALPRGE